jgi:hypothetical protein
MMIEEFYCDVCNRDSSDQVIIARWRDQNVCTDCLAHHDEMEQEGFFEE